MTQRHAGALLWQAAGTLPGLWAGRNVFDGGTAGEANAADRKELFRGVNR